MKRPDPAFVRIVIRSVDRQEPLATFMVNTVPRINDGLLIGKVLHRVTDVVFNFDAASITVWVKR